MTLRFIFDDANKLQVNVSTDIGDVIENGEVSKLLVNLVDANTDLQLDSVLATEGANNTFNYSFSDIPEGVMV